MRAPWAARGGIIIRMNGESHLRRDILFILASVALSLLIGRSSVIETVAGSSGVPHLIGNFVAGIFFTSSFTIAPAAVVLGQFSQTTPLLAVALVGAAGALLGDLILFFFIRDRVAEDIRKLLNTPKLKRLRHIFRLRFFRFLTPFIGAIIIASPLPDELGLALLGISRAPVALLVPVSFSMNFLGILAIGFLARAVV